ncbi:cytochrome c oxidase subunit II [Paraburkholderia fungorum]|uniref:cytochrome c oxidase subunit II n=1 Tax=Paraburkholderia fungorum TaxID=134537 RepID=UPI0038B73114
MSGRCREHQAVGISIGAALCASSPVCRADAPLNYFLHAAGPAASPTLWLNWVFTAICVAVCLTVALLLAGAILRRRPSNSENSRALGATKDGMLWIYVGVGISTPILVGMLVYALITLEAVATPRRTPQLTITVTAYDWWWKVAYDDSPDASQRFVTANEIHIPTGEPIRIKLRSADVIHTFWVPRLAGKTQAIPGQINEQWVQADVSGVYRGQCSQFCGAQHAHMAFEVVAQSPVEFNKWREDQARGQPATPEGSLAAVAGQKLFMDRCAGCHSVQGTAAQGMQAPDLTHLDSRRLIAAGTLLNSRHNQLDWIAHAQVIKPESLMPGIALSVEDAVELSAYLSTLK